MPLDTSIALQTQGPADPLERYGKALALRNAITQGKSQDLQLQSQQMDLEDQQKMRQAFATSGGDLDKLFQNAVQIGVGPKTLMQLKDSLLKQRESLAKIGNDELAVKKDHTEAIGSAAQGLLQLPTPEARAAAYPQAISALVQQGRIKPEEVPAQYPGDEQIQQFANVARSSQQIIDSVFKERETKAAEQNAASTAANAATAGKRETREADQQARQILGAKLGAAKSVAEYQQVLGAAPVALAQEFAGKTPEQARQMVMTGAEQSTAAHNAADEKAAQQRISVEQGRLNIEKQRYGFETGGGVSPQAKAIAAGEISPTSTRMMLRSNPGLIAQVKSVDPNFDEANIENRYATLKEFTSTSTGKAGGQVLALNTLIHHADLYQQAAAALKNGTFRPGNQAYNAIANAFGSAPPTNASLVGRFLAGETGKVATGGVPAEGEIKGILGSLGNDASPEQIANAGKTLLQIASGRATPLMERVKNAKLDKQVQVIGPDAQEILKRNGFDPETMKPATVPSGLTLQDIEAEIARRKKAK